MKIHLKNMRELGLAAFLGALLAGGLPIAHAEHTTGKKGIHGAMQKHGAHGSGTHMAQHGKSHSGGSKHGRHCKRHGKDHGGHKGKSHGRHHLFGDHWKKELTAEQKVQLDQLHVEFAKKKHTLKSGIKALEVQLAVLAVADEPQQEAVDTQINNLLTAKRQLIQAKHRYIAAQRTVLTPEQRVSFDMEVIHKAGTGTVKGKHGGGKH